MQNITNSLPQYPVGKIIIDGLFMLCVNERTRTAQLGVYEYANDHDLFIRVSKKDYNSNSILLKHGILIRKLDDRPQHEIETGDISILVSGRSADIACYQNLEVTEEMFLTNPHEFPNTEREFTEKGYTTDFRWVIDIESQRFHGKKLDVVSGVIQRKISLLNGILYTEKWVPRMITSAYVKPAEKVGQKPPYPFLYVANQLAVAIEKLEGEQTIDICYTQDGEPKTLSLPKIPKTEIGVYYEILISNNCPPSVAEKKTRQSDFQHYYNAIKMPVAERLELGIVPGSGSFRLPCDLVFLGQTPELV